MSKLQCLYKTILGLSLFLVTGYVQTEDENRDPFWPTSEVQHKPLQGVLVGEVLTQQQRWRVYRRGEQYHIELE